MIIKSMMHFIAIALCMIPNTGSLKECDMFGQWSRRARTKDRSPNCAQQQDQYSCGLFTMTNAFCLAFGFGLLCYRKKDLNYGKSPRIAAELDNEGLSEILHMICVICQMVPQIAWAICSLLLWLKKEMGMQA
jgi:hypothetical protein